MLSPAETKSAEEGTMFQGMLKILSLALWVVLAIAMFASASGRADVTQAEAEDAVLSVELARSASAHRPLFGIAFAEGGALGVAVGDRGTVVLTRDGGSTWLAQDADTDLALLDVALSGERMIAVGQLGLVLLKVDGGDWEQRPISVEERFLAVDLHADGLAVAVGGFGQARVSTDGGMNWTAPGIAFSSFVEGGYDPHLYAVDITDTGRIIVVGEFGLIVVSDDRGSTWRFVRRGDESLSAVHVRSDGVGYAVGQNGIVLKTVDSGDQWERVDAGLGGNLLGVSSTPHGVVIVPGMRNMLVSLDDGITFLPVREADINSNWYQQAAVGSDGMFVVGHSGRILRISAD